MTTTRYNELHRTALGLATMAVAFTRMGDMARKASENITEGLKKCPKCKGAPVPDWDDGTPAPAPVGCFDCDHTGTMEGFLKMQQQTDEAYGCLAEFEADQFNTALALCWKQRCKEETNMPRLARWFYAFKAWWCLKANWEGQMPDCDTVNAAILESHQDGYGWSATWLVVGQGLFTNWEAEIMHDSECTY